MNAYHALRETGGACALLETAPGPAPRRSILARHPRALVIADRRSTHVVTHSGTRQLSGDPLSLLRDLLRELTPGRWPPPRSRSPRFARTSDRERIGTPGFTPGVPEEGGIVGALAYDYARPRREPAQTPLLVALAVDRLLVMEDDRAVAGMGGARSPLDHDDVPGSAPEPWPGSAPAFLTRTDLPRFSCMTREEHRRLVLRIKDHIAAGDIYQANLSQRFRVPWPQDGLSLYDRLRRISPAPFSGYLRVGRLEIVSASPERLLRVEDDWMWTRPVAGTRPRSPDAETDRALAAELILSEKERAEHLMLVDLARNDLGRVAAVGSVEVDELMTVEEYPQVRHIVSNVRARLSSGSDALDALMSLFPGGTITGVPKIRCMEILDAVEPVPRGFYTGSLFYLTPSGRLDANILIRSAVVTPGCVTFHTGGGIVADSDPDFEYEETLHKAEGMRLALAG